MIHLLTESLLFKGLTESEKAECLDLFHYNIKSYNKDEILVHAYDEVAQLLILLRGSVRSEMTDPKGKTIKIADMEGAKVLAPGFLFGSHRQYPVSIIANTRVEVMRVTKESFLDSAKNNQQILLNFLDLVSNQTQFLTKKINFLNFKTIKGKIAQLLLIHHHKQNTLHLTMHQSQTQLADLFGVTRPSLSRAINEMSQDAIIKLEKKHITILDIQSLKGLLE